MLKAGASPVAVDHNGHTPLHEAAKSGFVDVVRALLSAHPADIPSRDYVDFVHTQHHATALYVAARTAHVEVVKLLLEAGANPNVVVGHDGGRPLHAAAREGSAETVRALVTARADVNAMDKFKWTPLHAAVSASKLLTTEALLELGALVKKDNN